MNKCKNCQSVLPDRVVGKMGRNQLFCNPECGRLFRRELVFVEKPTNCAFCFAPLIHNGAGNPKRYCSRKHAALFRQANKPKVPKVEKICVWCSKVYLSNIKASRFCCADCRTKQVAVESRLKRAAAGMRVYSSECDRCHQAINRDSPIGKSKYGRFCRPCALVRQRERYRLKTAKRQGVMNPIRISADVLIERDGNICHICNTEIDLSLARNSRFGATIDHIVPLSKGGLDVLENLKLAHWICNIKKGNRVDA